MQAYLYAAATILFGIYGQLMLKSRAGVHFSPGTDSGQFGFLFRMLTDPWVWTSLAGAFAGALCWMLAVRHLNLSTLYPVLASSFVLIPLASALVLGESIAPQQIVGCAIIAAGIVLATRPA